ncbi:hypothetical protein TNCV_1820831 [Trichonephila clavipes]|nr:hypothetical protein TNCV_1820831 [Trichonephila clavipes]
MQTEESRHLIQMMISAYNRRGALFSIRDDNPLQLKVRLLFQKKLHPCLIRDSNPLGYKPRVISTILAGWQLKD